MLNANIDEVLQTLDREQMKLEVIFREIIDDKEYLYWFSIQGEAGEMANTSPYSIDKKHIEFHEECINHNYRMRDAQLQVVLVPQRVAQAMDWTPLALAVEFQRRELIYRRENRREGSEGK